MGAHPRRQSPATGGATEWLRSAACAVVIAGCLGCRGPSAAVLARPPELTPAPLAAPNEPTLPKSFVDAASFLLAHGLADPRGGHLVTGTTNDGKHLGWLVPAKDGRPEYLAGIDGLARYDIRDSKPAGPTDLVREAAFGPDKDYFVGSVNRPLLIGAMALVHGDNGVAGAIWREHQLKSPFYRLASAYVFYRNRRAGQAAAAGDYATTESDADSLAKNQVALEAEAKRHPDPTDDEVHPRDALGEPIYFVLLAGARGLAEDAHKHRTQGDPDQTLFAQVDKLPQNERIAKLIDALAQVQPQGGSTPEEPMFLDNRVLGALAKESPAAIEPLLDAYEHDLRVTPYSIRSQVVGRPSANITVHTLIWRVLQMTQMFPMVGTHGVPPSIEQLRAQWNQIHGLTPPEVWVHTLTDDHVDTQAWAAAATLIVDRVGTNRAGWSYTVPNAEPGHPLPMQGEILRSRRNPSVSDLMTRRAADLTHWTTGNSGHWFEVGDALKIALNLITWDRAAALPALQVSSRAILTGGGFPGAGPPYVQAFVPQLSDVVEARVKLGDKSALNEFAQWVPTNTDIHSVFGSEGRMFKPLVEFRNEASMQAAAKKLFSDPTSPWNQKSMARTMPQLVTTPLLEVPVFFDSVVAALADKTVTGTASRDGNQFRSPTGGYYIGDHPDLPPGAPKEESFEFRECDGVAYALSHLEGAPKFEAYWPTPRRDLAIGQISAYIRKNRRRIGDLLVWPDSWQESPNYAQQRRQAAARK